LKSSNSASSSAIDFFAVKVQERKSIKTKRNNLAHKSIILQQTSEEEFISEKKLPSRNLVLLLSISKLKYH